MDDQVLEHNVLAAGGSHTIVRRVHNLKALHGDVSAVPKLDQSITGVLEANCLGGPHTINYNLWP